VLNIYYAHSIKFCLDIKLTVLSIIFILN